MNTAPVPDSLSPNRASVSRAKVASNPLKATMPTNETMISRTMTATSTLGLVDADAPTAAPDSIGVPGCGPSRVPTRSSSASSSTADVSVAASVGPPTGTAAADVATTAARRWAGDVSGSRRMATRALASEIEAAR